MTSEQMEASRAERLRQNGHGTLTLEDARTWIEETGLSLFLPRRQFSSSIAPSFVEAVAGERNATPDPKHIQLAEELLVRLELDGVAVRLNLLGLPGEQPDFVVANWVLPYVYALRGDRDWRRSPQLTGSRQVSQLAVQTYKLLEVADTNLSELTRSLGREVTEVAVLRAITELWQQLRIIPVIAAPGESAKWQLLRTRFQKAIAEGASTSQVTAISVLASIYLQAVIAASMEEVELFLAPLTARSKVREVLRGLVATRQVHTLSLGHAPHFYVAGTLPEFSVAPTIYASASMAASPYFMREQELELDSEEDLAAIAPATPEPVAAPPVRKAAEPRATNPPVLRKPAASNKAAAPRPHFSRPAPHARDRKPAQGSASSRPARRPGSDSRTSAAPAAKSARPASGARWTPNAPANSNGARSNGSTARPSRPATGKPAASGNGSAQSTSSTWNQRNGNGHSSKPTGKSAAPAHNGSGSPRGTSAPRSANAPRSSSAPRKDARPAARPAHSGSSRKPTLAAGAKAGNSKSYNFTARPKQEKKKRG